MTKQMIKMRLWRRGLKKYPKSYSAHIARGTVFQRRAWSARGGDFAYQISDSEMRDMAEFLPTARASLTAAIKLSPRPSEACAQLIDLAMLDGGRREAECGLAEANQRFPNNYYPKRSYMKLLRPQWGGSMEQMEAFRAAYAKRGEETWKTNCMEAWVLDQKVWKTTISFAAEKSICDQAIMLCPTTNRYVQRAHFYLIRIEPTLLPWPEVVHCMRLAVLATVSVSATSRCTESCAG
jgi:hypothetical protein